MRNVILSLFLVTSIAINASNYKVIKTNKGIVVVNSYRSFWDKDTINHLYESYNFKRSKSSLYAEWFLHTLSYKIGYKRARARSTTFEYGNNWLKAALT